LTFKYKRNTGNKSLKYMPTVRQLNISTAPCPAPIAQSQAANACAFRIGLGTLARVVFKKQSGANPFTTTTILAEATWDTLLALATDPDNVLLSKKLWESSVVSGEPNTVESASGQKQSTHYANDVISLSWKEPTAQEENDLMVSLRDNSSDSLECLLINTKGEIIGSKGTSPTEVKWFPISYATIKGRSAEGGRGGLEMLMATLEFYEDVLNNWAKFKPTFDILKK
jgi:hypothetical protein